MARRRTTLFALAGLTSGLVAAGNPAVAETPDPVPEKLPLAVGTGGAVATVDLDATRVGLEVLAAAAMPPTPPSPRPPRWA